jgi:hypothetical protein
MLHSEELFSRMLERAVRGRTKAGRRTRKLGNLPDRVYQGLRKRAVHASVRSPESLFDELEDLNLVLELKGRIRNSG